MLLDNPLLMYPLFQPMIRLLSTDFDGTLVDHFASPPVVPELFSLLRDLQRGGTLWAVNTGRALGHILEGLKEFRFPVLPDYVVTTEREVYRKGKSGWEAFGDWNKRCYAAHDELFAAAGPLLDSILEHVNENARAEVIYENGRPVGLVAASEQEMKQIVEFIDNARLRLPAFSYMQNTMYLRFCHSDYSKGSALAELGRLVGIDPENICAIGDHFNDIPMLDGRYARMTGCPSNAAEKVKEIVRASHGVVAGGGCSAGVVEIIHHFWKQPKRDAAARQNALSP